MWNAHMQDNLRYKNDSEKILNRILYRYDVTSMPVSK
jgi:hypothetical protein